MMYRCYYHCKYCPQKWETVWYKKKWFTGFRRECPRCKRFNWPHAVHDALSHHQVE
jgi:hypothetical protein